MFYDVQTKQCFLQDCLNPHLFMEWKGQKLNYNFQISQKINIGPNKLLARGKNE